MKRSLMQVYVKGSVEAVDFYKKAFDAGLGYNVKSPDGTFYHSELDVGGQIVAVSEAANEKSTGSTMQFCLQYGEGEEDKVKKAYEVLKEGAKILFPLGPCDFSTCMADFIDKFGVRWCLFV
ncbi:MAG TPA: VOC family protein [Ruminiclostridium sp.]|nr:VOC family protein [Ruminiclostridium sp.]